MPMAERRGQKSEIQHEFSGQAGVVGADGAAVPPQQKRAILDEFVAATGHARKWPGISVAVIRGKVTLSMATQGVD